MNWEEPLELELAPAAGLLLAEAPAVELEEQPVSSTAPDTRTPAATRPRWAVVLRMVRIMTGGSSVRLRDGWGAVVVGTGEHTTTRGRPNRTGVEVPWANSADLL